MRRWTVAILAACTAAGCGLIQLKPPKDPVTRSVLTPEESWARVLSQRVDAEGRVDFDGLRNDPSDLYDFVSYLATFSPESDELRFPTAASKLAYFVNAYNALAIYEVVDSDARPADLRKFFSRTKIVVGGELHSLTDLEDDVARLKDPRAYFALSVPARGAPRLARVPYTAGAIEAQLERATMDFINDPRAARVDRAQRVLWLSDLFQRHEKVFLTRAVSLPAYVNRYRTDKLPEKYAVKFMPFDAALYAQGTAASRPKRKRAVARAE